MLQFVTVAESFLVDLQALENAAIIVTFGSGFPVTNHLDQVQKTHAPDAIRIMLWVMTIVGVVMVKAGLHCNPEPLILLRAIGAACELGGELLEDFYFGGFQLALVVNNGANDKPGDCVS